MTLELNSIGGYKMKQKLDFAEDRAIFIESDEGHKKVDNFKAIWNSSQNNLGCIACKEYKIIQHEDAVNSLTTALKNLNIKFEQKIIVQGHRIFVDIVFTETQIKLKEVGEEFVAGIRLINSYDKTTGLLILPRLMRKVCANGMIVSKFFNSSSIRHNSAQITDYEAIIQRTLKTTINSSDKLQMLVSESMKDSVEWKLVELILTNLTSTKKHADAIMGKLPSGGKITRWDIYNAITSYATHDTQLKPNIEYWLQNRAQTLLSQPLEVLCRVKNP